MVSDELRARGFDLPEAVVGRTVFDLIKRQAELRPDALAFCAASAFGGEHRLSYGEFRLRAEALARGLLKLKIRFQDRVGIMMDNDAGLEAGITMMALHRLGLVVVPINTRFAAEEIVYVLNKAQCVAVVATTELACKLSNLTAQIPNLRSIIAVGADVTPPHLDWRELALASDHGATATWPDVSVDAMSEILFTSGTTAHPKGAVMTHARSVISAYGFAAAMSLVSDDIYESFFPFFTTAQLHCVLLPAWWAGAAAVLDSRFDLPAILARMQREKTTKYIGAPTFYAFLLDSYDPAAHDLSHLRMFDYGGAPMSVDVIARLSKIYPHVELRQTYGMTESGPAGTVLRGEDSLSKLGSVGRPWPLTEVRIADDSGAILPAHALGEIEIRSPTVMREYHDQPELTAATFHDGWLRTGDLGYLDDDGFLYHVDRKKDMIIRGGHNIGSLEVEEAFFRHPAVLEASVVSVPHPKLGEDIHAFVVRRPGHEINVAILRAFCSDKLADYKIPRLITFVDELPRGPMGKVLKSKLRDAARDLASKGT